MYIYLSKNKLSFDVLLCFTKLICINYIISKKTRYVHQYIFKDKNVAMELYQLICKYHFEI